MVPEPELKGNVEKGQPLLVAMNPFLAVIVGLEEALKVDSAANGGKGLLLLAEQELLGKLFLYILVGQLCSSGKLFGLNLLKDMVYLVLAPGACIGRGRKTVHHIEGIDILINLVIKSYDPLSVAGLCTAGKNAEH